MAVLAVMARCAVCGGPWHPATGGLLVPEACRGGDAPRDPSAGSSARGFIHLPAAPPGPAVARALEPRTARVGASEVAAVLGVPGAWGTPFGVWARKVGLPESEQSPVLRRGHVVEPGLLRWLGRELGAELTDCGGDAHAPWVVARDGRWPHVGCHPDGYLFVPAGESVLFRLWCGAEAKSTRDQWDEPPPHVWVQVQVALALTALPAWHVAHYATLSEALSRWRIDPDAETAREMLERVEAWWAAHVEADLPPPVDASEDARRWLLSRYPRQRAPLRRATAEEADLAREVARLRRVKREVEAAEKLASARLCERIGEADGLELEAGRATWRAQSESRVDVKRLRAEAPELATRFEKTTETRKLFVHIEEEET